MRATVGVLLLGGLLVALLLWVKGIYGPLDALRYGMFNTVSVGHHYGLLPRQTILTWPVFAPVFMLILSGMATSAGLHGRRHQNLCVC